jgi:prepilin-type N-terminal cleavage/methylation domain-containing protein
MKRAAGFTLVEILVVMGLFGVAAGLTYINFIRPQNTVSLDGAVKTLMADIKSQQTKAMAGDSGSASSAQAHGIYVQSGQYTLFKGSTYSAGDTDNFVVLAPTGVTFSTSFTDTQVVFTKGSGDFTGYSASTNTVTVSSGPTSENKVITLNRYGAITVN